MGQEESTVDTLLLPVDMSDSAAVQAALTQAAAVIRRGGLVAFPTETVYGLGANALDAGAVGRIYEAKRRDHRDPCIVHIASMDDLARVVSAVPASVTVVAEALWPGPLSLILPRGRAIPDVVSAGRPTVAVRMPAHAVALALIRAAGVPLAAPSANTFGHISPTTAQHVWDDLAGRIDLILDGGPTPIGVESTVLDLSGPVPTLLRHGGVPLRHLRDLLGNVVVAEQASGPAATSDEGDLSPGLSLRHYAPRGELLLYEGPRLRVLAALTEQALELLGGGGVLIGALLDDDDALALSDAVGKGLLVARLGHRSDLPGVARRLFAGLRDLETRGATVILARGFGGEPAGLGAAIQDRLVRAASGRVITLH